MRNIMATLFWKFVVKENFVNKIQTQPEISSSLSNGVYSVQFWQFQSTIAKLGKNFEAEKTATPLGGEGVLKWDNIWGYSSKREREFYSIQEYF